MDITSPFIVVPILAITFLCCIGYATLTGNAHTLETPPDDSNAKVGTH